VLKLDAGHCIRKLSPPVHGEYRQRARAGPPFLDAGDLAPLLAVPEHPDRDHRNASEGVGECDLKHQRYTEKLLSRPAPAASAPRHGRPGCPEGVASTRRLNAGSGGIGYVIVIVWLARYAADRLAAHDRLVARGTLVLDLGIDFFLGPHVTSVRLPSRWVSRRWPCLLKHPLQRDDGNAQKLPNFDHGISPRRTAS
jgi:hypothetical protein